MAPREKGMGKGLGALLGDDFSADFNMPASTLPVSQIESCRNQPRKSFDQEKLEELADSIRQHGVIQPLTVRKLASGYYQIIAGERRWRAARLAGLEEIPAVIIEADDRKAMELAMIENLQREDLNPMEEAEGFRTLVEEYGLTQEQAALSVGRSRSAVANSMRLLDLAFGVVNMPINLFDQYVCLYQNITKHLKNEQFPYVNKTRIKSITGYFRSKELASSVSIWLFRSS